MSCILLLLEHKESRRLLSEWLGRYYQVLCPDSIVELPMVGSQETSTQERSSRKNVIPLLEEPFDLCILDMSALERLGQWLQTRKEAVLPVFLPFLLISSRQEIGIASPYLLRSVDELIISPIEKVELQARLSMLLRARQMSRELNDANQQQQKKFLEYQLAQEEREKAHAEAELLHDMQTEKELAQLKSRFVSMVANEFRNPLNAILGSAQMLERYSNQWSQETKNKFFLRIKAGVRKMLELLDDVMVIAQADEGKLEFNPAPLDLAEFCCKLVEEMQKSASANQKIVHETSYGYDCVTQDEFPHVWMDEKLLHKIFTNLLSNAIKYSPEGGIINFDLIYQEREVIFQIKDRGIGIPQEDQRRLFEPFHRAKNVGNIDGTGLGLAIVKQSVDLHCGKIALVSEAGVGTKITVTLPLAISN